MMVRKSYPKIAVFTALLCSISFLASCGSSPKENTSSAASESTAASLSETAKSTSEETPESSEEEPPLPVPDVEGGEYTAYAEALDWGCYTTRIILPASGDFSALNPEDFSVTADKIDRETGETAMVAKSYTSAATVPAIGDVGVKDAFWCNETGEKEEDGGYLSLLLDYGPDNAYSSLNFTKNSYTCISEPIYTISYQGALLSDSGMLSIQNQDLIHLETSESGLPIGWIAPQMENDAPPLIVWLHGAGEGGTDTYAPILGNRVINLASDEIQGYFGGAYLLAPQAETMWMDNGTGNYTADGTSCYTEKLMDTIETFVSAHPEIDEDRIYIGGCSNGGFMTMRMVLDYPDYFAAAFPVCEALYDSLISDEALHGICDLPIWFTHAANDPIVAPSLTSVATYQRLINAGNENAHLSYFEKVTDPSGMFTKADGSPYEYFGHASWIYALDNLCTLDFNGSPVLLDGEETTLFQWLAAQHR